MKGLLESRKILNPANLTSALATIKVPLFDQDRETLTISEDNMVHMENRLYNMIPFTDESIILPDRKASKQIIEDPYVLKDNHLVVVQGSTNSQTVFDAYLTSLTRDLRGVTVVGLDLSHHCLQYGIATARALEIPPERRSVFQGNALAIRKWRDLYPKTTQKTLFVSLLGPVLSKEGNIQALRPIK